MKGLKTMGSETVRYEKRRKQQKMTIERMRAIRDRIRELKQLKENNGR